MELKNDQLDAKISSPIKSVALKTYEIDIVPQNKKELDENLESNLSNKVNFLSRRVWQIVSSRDNSRSTIKSKKLSNVTYTPSS